MDDADLAPYPSFVGIPIADKQSIKVVCYSLVMRFLYCCSHCRGHISHMLETEHSELLGPSFVSINQVVRKKRLPLYINQDDTQFLSFLPSFFLSFLVSL
jgi:hypothetical protein